MVIDPIADMINRMKNASRVGQETVAVPFSNLKLRIAETLKKEGYITDINKKGKGIHSELVLELAYVDKKSKITDVRRVSKPSCRVYVSKKEIKPVRRGYGRSIVSTPKGILTGNEARQQNLGGELLFMIW